MGEGIIAERLSFLLEQRGMNYTDLANACGVSRSMIGQLAKGTFPNPTVRILGEIARALGTTIAYLIGESDVTIPAPFSDKLEAEGMPYLEVAWKAFQAGVPVGMLESIVEHWKEKKAPD
jgi:transcriptional regulator with XRE-family HTH domain